MKVKLAAHALSSSIADALEYLQQCGNKGFQEVDKTVKFIRAIDALFDFLNSRNIFQLNLKQAISPGNLKLLDDLMQDKINYLFDLTADGNQCFNIRKGHSCWDLQPPSNR